MSVCCIKRWNATCSNMSKKFSCYLDVIIILDGSCELLPPEGAGQAALDQLRDLFELGELSRRELDGWRALADLVKALHKFNPKQEHFPLSVFEVNELCCILVLIQRTPCFSIDESNTLF